MDKSLKDKLTHIADVREQKGKEAETFELIEDARQVANENGDNEALAKLFWEESLNWQHLVMNERADGNNSDIIKQGTEKMALAAKNAYKLIKDNNLKNLLGVAHRFLGRVEDYNGRHSQALTEYQTALEHLQGTKSMLEVSGFVAYDIVMTGNVEEGIQKGVETFEMFENSDIGKKLKSEDYITWGIWISGIFPRIVGGLEGKQISREQAATIKKYLEKGERYITEPEGKTTWGGENPFSYRKKEQSAAKEMLKKLMVLVISFVAVLSR
jgi:tetratricopeptide (TPR) repeat protein